MSDRYYLGNRYQQTNEKNLKRIITGGIAGVALACGIGLTADKWDEWFNDPNKIAECPLGWSEINNEVGGFIGNNTMSNATAQLEAGRTELVSQLHTTMGNDINLVYAESIPGTYKVATSLLIGEAKDGLYDTNNAILDTPTEQFCWNSPSLYLSPSYIQAEAALKASGINTFNTQEK